MNRRHGFLAALGLAAMLVGGAAQAGNDRHGIPHPGKGYGHVKHQGYGHSRHYSRGHSKHYYRGYSRHGYRGHGYRYSRDYYVPRRVIYHSRTVHHVHGPRCGHSGYHGYGYRSHYSPYYRRDYGRAAFSGYDDGVGYYLEFKY